MSRALNIISQVIHLAKKAKSQIERGKYSSVRRLFKIMLNLEEEELIFIRHESGSDELYKTCVAIVRDTRKAYHNVADPSSLDVNKVEGILDRIIELENIELKNIVKPNPNLRQKVIDQIDPYIQDLMNEMSKLSFVVSTLWSCSGHERNRFVGTHSTVGAYFVIRYRPRLQRNMHIMHLIQAFHRDMCKNVSKVIVEVGLNRTRKIGPNVDIHLLTSFDVAYYLYDEHGFLGIRTRFISINRFKKLIMKRWRLIYQLVRKYQDIEKLEHRRPDIKFKHDLK